MAPARSARRSYTGPIIDAHAHLTLPGIRPVQIADGYSGHGPSDYLKRMGDLDVKFVGALVMAPRSDLPQTRRMNNAVLGLTRTSGGRFFALCSVHPADGKAALGEIDRVARAGARGLKLHPNTQQFDVADRSVRSVVARATQRGLPVLFDAYSPFDANQAGKFVQLAMQLPEARLILAHAHGPRFPELLVYEVLSRYEWWRRNVWIDLSATAPMLANGPFRDQFIWVLRKVGADRLLFGSDYPLDDPKVATAAVASMGFSSEELEGVFYRNARSLFGL